MLFFLPRPYFKCGSYQLNEKTVHQSNGKASYAQGGFQTLHLLGDVIPSSLSGSGGSMGAGVSHALGFEGGGLGARLGGRLREARH